VKKHPTISRAKGFWPRTAFFWLFMSFLYGPIAVIVLLSFQGPTGGLTFPMQGTSLHWFKEVINPSMIGDFRWPFGRSIFLGLGVMVLTVFISFLAGLAFRKNFKGNIIMFYLVVACLIAPSFLISLGIGLAFANLEMESAWYTGGLGAHLSWTLPFGVLIMLAVFSRLDKTIEEAARDLGANEWQSLRNVVIPITLPGMIAVGLFGFTLSYDEFPRTSLVSGIDNTLPVEMVAVTGTGATPSLYAVGTMTTFFSLAVIIGSFIAIFMLQKRRSGRRASSADLYGKPGAG
jgi:putative spermidine/putrescine transport system permease protein